jgi:hypothetical protein
MSGWHKEVSKSLSDAVASVLKDYSYTQEERKNLKVKKEAAAKKVLKAPEKDEFDLETKAEESGDAAAYKKFFNKALKKFGAKSPADMDDEKKKKFFGYIEKNWDSADEEMEVSSKNTSSKKNETIANKVKRIKRESIQGKKKIKLSGKKEKVNINPSV